MNQTVTVVLDDDSTRQMSYEDALRLWTRLRWVLDEAHLKSKEK